MPPTFYNLLSLFLRVDGVNLGVRIDGVYGCASARIVPCTKVRGYSAPGPTVYKEEPTGASVYRHTSKFKDTLE